VLAPYNYIYFAISMYQPPIKGRYDHLSVSSPPQPVKITKYSSFLLSVSLSLRQFGKLSVATNIYSTFVCDHLRS